MARTLEQILSALDPYDVRQTGSTYRANCPAHGGEHRNLSLFLGEKGDWCVSCHSRHCPTEDIWRSLNLWDERDGQPRAKAKTPSPAKTKAEQQAIHIYRLNAANEIEGLAYGPLPEGISLEACGPWASIVDMAWDIYAAEGSREAVRTWLNAMADELRASAPGLWRELQSRAKRRQKAAERHAKTNGQPPELQTYTLAELAKREFPPRVWIVPQILSEGVHLIAGKSGLGKSFWALDLGLAVARGGNAWGRIKVQQGEVLYLDLESDEQEMQIRVERLLDDGSAWPDAFHVRHDIPTLDQGLVPMIDRWLGDHPQAKLIVIDVLAKIRGDRKLHGDIDQQDYAVGEALKPVAAKYHVAIVLLHHTNKLVKPEDPLDSISGSTGLIGPATIKGVFARGREQVDAKLFVTGRTVHERWIAFQYRACIWTYLGPAEDFERPDERRQLRAILAAHYPTPVSRRDLTAQMQKDANAMGQLLMRMEQAEEIKRVKRGLYSLPVSSLSPNNNNIDNIEDIRNNVTNPPAPEFVTPPPESNKPVTTENPRQAQAQARFVSVVTDSTPPEKPKCPGCGYQHTLSAKSDYWACELCQYDSRSNGLFHLPKLGGDAA